MASVVAEAAGAWVVAAVVETLVVVFCCAPPEVRMWLIPHAAAGTITSTARKGHTLFHREGC